MASASRWFVLYFAIIVFVLQMFVEAAGVGTSTVSGQQTNAMNRSLQQTIDCSEACARRCKEAFRHNVCFIGCGTCCAKCSCVPPATSGNQDLCPCYTNLKTHRNKPKCPSL